MTGEKAVPKLAESIPAVTAPVKMPRLVPGRASYLAGVITGCALIVLCVGGIVFYFAAGLAS